MVFGEVFEEQRFALAAVDHGADDQSAAGHLLGHDDVAGDGAVVVGHAVGAEVFFEAVKGIGFVLILVLLPFGVVHPDAVGARQVVAFNGRQKLIGGAAACPVGPPGPGKIDGAAGEKPAGNEAQDHSSTEADVHAGAALGTGGVELGCIHQGHRGQYLGGAAG